MQFVSFQSALNNSLMGPTSDVLQKKQNVRGRYVSGLDMRLGPTYFLRSASDLPTVVTHCTSLVQFLLLFDKLTSNLMAITVF